VKPAMVARTCVVLVLRVLNAWGAPFVFLECCERCSRYCRTERLYTLLRHRESPACRRSGERHPGALETERMAVRVHAEAMRH
jgi:hypothetical protein